MSSLFSMTRRRWLQGTAGAATCCTLGIQATQAVQPVAKSRVDVPWLAEVQTAPPNGESKAAPLAPLLTDTQGRKLETRAAWAGRRAELHDRWSKILGLQHVARPTKPKVTVVETERVGDVERKLIRYETHPGWFVEAYVLRPAAGSALDRRPRPAAIALHSTVDHTIRQPAGLEGPPEKFFGLKLAQRGFACICPRNYLWPETSGRIAAKEEAERFLKQFPGATGMAKMLHDSQIALDILLGEPGVDSSRVTAVGHSLGAKEVLYLAAFDDRVTCTVSSEGGIGTRFSNWDAAWYLGPQIKAESFRAEHHELLGIIAPKPFLLVGGNSADGDASWPYIAAALPAYRLLEDGPPRLGLLNHRQGHMVPKEVEPRLYEWMETYGRG